jgi:hypothetical protein
MAAKAGYCPQRQQNRKDTPPIPSRKASKRVIGLPAELVELLRLHQQERKRAVARRLWIDEGWCSPRVPVGRSTEQ